MNGLLNGTGFLGTQATFRSDITLILILISAVLFTIGWQLAIRKRYEAHHWGQTSYADLVCPLHVGHPPGGHLVCDRVRVWHIADHAGYQWGPVCRAALP
jgi:hypothetical protein